MKNLSLGVKLGIGFAVILCISCLLGGMAIWKMKEQDQGSTLISEVFVPEVNFAVQYERATRVLREAVLNFTNTGDEQYYRKSQEQMDEMERLSGEVDKLVAAFPFLTLLTEHLTRCPGKAFFTIQMPSSVSTIPLFGKSILVTTPSRTCPFFILITIPFSQSAI